MNIKFKHIMHHRLIKTASFCFMLAIIPFVKLIAQPIPVGSIREDQFRILQLLSDSTATTSFSNRSIWFSTYKKVFDESNSDASTWWGKPLRYPQKTFSVVNYPIKLGAYEPVIKNTYNSGLPYGENNGAAWYGRGWNNELQAGLYLTSPYFTLTLRPHLFYTQNKDFAPPYYIPRYGNGDIRYVNQGRLPTYRLGDRIDRPFRFGPDPYWTLDLGQSSIRAHYKGIEAGVSNETMWWGPGNRYALALSNNAAGFPHVFIGSREPIQLPFNIGGLEFKWMLGRLESSPYFDLDYYDIQGEKERVEARHTLGLTRIINGLNVIYSPSFLPNLSIGVARVIQQYVPDGGLSFNDDILGVFKAFPKPDDEVYDDFRDDSNFEKKDPKASVFFRWIFPKSDAEFYGELYKGDHNVNLRDFLMEPQHGRAYTLGLQKILEFDGAINFVKVNAEINSTSQGPVDELRPQTYIYTHATIKQGYTNKGQILGAAIGPGSQSQFLGVDGYFKHGKLGVFAQREVLNNNFFYERLDRYYPQVAGFKDLIHHRINLNVGLNATYKLGHVLLDGSFIFNRNYNYGRSKGAYPYFFTSPVPIVDNLQYQLALRYLF